jgi:hypothetical protein
MHNKSVMCSLLVVAVVVTISIEPICYYTTKEVYAHILYSNENAALLAIFYQIQTEAELAQRNYVSDITLSQKHAKNAIELLNKNWTISSADRMVVVDALKPALDRLNSSINQNSSYFDIEQKIKGFHFILDEFIYIYVGEDILKNSTIQALTLAEITNVIDNKYSSTYGTDSKKMADMLDMSSFTMNNNRSSSINMNSNNKQSEIAEEKNNDTRNPISTNTIANMSDYQTAQALAIQTQAIFNNHLKVKASPDGTATTISELGKDIHMLKISITNRASYEDIMTIIHARIHPHLMTAYNLK